MGQLIPPLSGGFVLLGPGPTPMGANTSSLLSGGSFSGAAPIVNNLPSLAFPSVGTSYDGILHGNYSLASTTPGNVVAILSLNGTSISTTITNLLAGTPGAWWDATSTLTCTALSGNQATIQQGITLTFQAAAGVTAAQPFNRGQTITVTLTNGACTFDLQRTFTNANNQMSINSLSVVRTA